MSGRKKKGFTLVELLATIAVLGILSLIAVAAVSHYLDQAHKEQLEQNKKTMTIAVEMYLQTHRELFPKQIGDSTKITAKDLRKDNYLKEDLKNSKGESCMENSFVQVYMMGKNDYSYVPHLLCGSETYSEDSVPKPEITYFKFQSDDNQFNDIKNASFKFTINGGTAADGSHLGIYSYQYAISVVYNHGSDYKEVYNSGSISGKKEKEITVQSKKLSYYVDIVGITDIKVDIIVFNEVGGRRDESKTTNMLGATYQDKKGPECGDINGQALDDNDWINKASVKRERQITVGCKDNPNGSGCQRKKFSQTWPYGGTSKYDSRVKFNYGARWSYITIQDNAKKSTDCYVRVNVDLKAPTLVVNVYKATASGGKGDLVYNGVFDDTEPNNLSISHTIHSNEYSQLVGGWMNSSNYPYGILIDVEAQDNLYLYDYTWKTNDPDVPIGASENTIKSSLSSENGSIEQQGSGTSPTGVLTVFDNADGQEEHGNLSINISGLRIQRDGRRVGELKVCDKAGNCTTLYVYADLDRSAPESPIITMKKATSGELYLPSDASNYANQEDNWSQEKIIAQINRSDDDLVDWDHFEYLNRKETSHSGSTYTWANTSYQTTADGKFIISEDGVNLVNARSCDKAGNCSTGRSDDYVKIDKTAPTCNVYAVYESNGNIYDGKWTNKSVKVYNTCTDQTKGSQCEDDMETSFSYTGEVETTKATQQGIKNNKLTVKDKAGNEGICSYKTVKVDQVAPSDGICKITYSYNKSTPASNYTRLEYTKQSTDASSGISTTTYSNRGYNAEYVYNSTAEVKCETTYTGSITVKDKAGNSNTFACTSATTPACCSEGTWQDDVCSDRGYKKQKRYNECLGKYETRNTSACCTSAKSCQDVECNVSDLKKKQSCTTYNCGVSTTVTEQSTEYCHQGECAYSCFITDKNNLQSIYSAGWHVDGSIQGTLSGFTDQPTVCLKVLEVRVNDVKVEFNSAFFNAKGQVGSILWPKWQNYGYIYKPCLNFWGDKGRCHVAAGSPLYCKWD